jgi:hypothetical protein
VLLVLNAIFTLVFLNRLVMKVVSFPTYVNVAHFCGGVCVFVVIVFLNSVRWRFPGGRVDREGVVVEDVLDGSDFCVVVVFL